MAGSGLPAVGPAAFQANDAVARAGWPVRACRAAMPAGASPAGADENLAGAMATPAFRRGHRRLLSRDTMLLFNDRVHPLSPQRDWIVGPVFRQSLH